MLGDLNSFGVSSPVADQTAYGAAIGSSPTLSDKGNARQAISTWRQLESLRKDWLSVSTKEVQAEAMADNAHQKRLALEASGAEPEAGSPTAEGYKQQEATYRRQAEQAKNRKEVLWLEMTRQAELLKRMNVYYDLATGRFSYEGNSNTVTAMELVLAYWEKLKQDGKRQIRAHDRSEKANDAIASLMTLLSAVNVPASATTPGAVPTTAAEEQTRRVRAFIKTSYTVSGPAGTGSKAFEAFAPIMADEADVDGNGIVASSLEPGVRGGWNPQLKAHAPSSPVMAQGA